MEFLSTMEHGGAQPMPPGVTPITELKQQKRVSRTLSKAVSLHLEGKLESAANLLSKAIEEGEKCARDYGCRLLSRYRPWRPISRWRRNSTRRLTCGLIPFWVSNSLSATENGFSRA